MNGPSAYCILVHPPKDSDQVRRLARRCRERAERRGYRLKAVRASSLRVVGGSGRRLNLLVPLDASTIYRTLHRAPTMVAALAPAFVSLDPSREPPNRRYARSLKDFVAYKASFGLVRGEPDVDSLFDEFGRWREAVHCEDFSDPRALPLHVFEIGANEFDLAQRQDAIRFRQAFGRSSERRDGAGRLWRVGPAHGREEHCVAGLTLPPGQHWDVSGEGRSWRIANASEVWKVDGRAYVNASPNEHLRGPRVKCRGRARLVWNVGTTNAPRRKKERH